MASTRLGGTCRAIPGIGRRGPDSDEKRLPERPRERTAEAQRFRCFLRASVEIDTDSLANCDKCRSFWSQTKQRNTTSLIGIHTTLVHDGSESTGGNQCGARVPPRWSGRSCAAITRTSPILIFSQPPCTRVIAMGVPCAGRFPDNRAPQAWSLLNRKRVAQT